MAVTPLLGRIPPAKRTRLFAPTAIVLGLIGMFAVGLANVPFVAALLVGFPLGVAAAWWLLGTPEVKRSDGRPWIEPSVRPYMAVPTAFVAGAVLYILVGIVATAIPQVPTDYAAYLALAVAVIGGVALGLALFGPPPLARAPIDAWKRIPPERKPWTFFPIALVLFALLYYGLGVALTAYVPSDDAPQALIALPIALLVSCTLAFLLVGIPRPRRSMKDVLPPIPARGRPALFAATIVLLGPFFGFLLGPLITASDLPGVLDLYAGLAAGVVLAALLAAVVWGGPRRWARHGEWRTEVAPPVRLALFAPTTLLVGVAAVALLDLTGLPFAASLGIGVLLGLGAGLAASGGLRRVPSAPKALRDTPEVVKPLLFFATWLLAGGAVYVAFMSLFFAHPGWGAAVAIAVGFASAVAVVEAPLLLAWRDERRRDRLEVRELRKERAARLSGLQPMQPARVVTPTDPADAKRGLLSRLRRK